MKFIFIIILSICLFSQAFAQKSHFNPRENAYEKAESDFAENHVIYRLHVSKTEIDEQLRSMKEEYVKDSLKILLLKLMNLERLTEEHLLDLDIESNHSYYVSLLQEFKGSEIDPEKYLYLENQCNIISLRKMKSKLRISISAFGMILLSLFTFIFIYKKRSQRQEIEFYEVQLTPQEKLVKELILQDFTNKEIAKELFVSLSTVKTHISNLYKKYQINSRAELKNL